MSWKTGRVVLRERDFEILAALERWGVLGLAQLDGLAFKKEAPAGQRVRLFFNEMDRSLYSLACYKRLRDLELAGLVQGHFYLNHPKVFGLTDRGHCLLLDRGRARLRGFRRGLTEALLPHELAVNGVGLVIDQLLKLPVKGSLERRIQAAAPAARRARRRAMISDLWIVDREHPRPIEVELTQKAEFRYKELWQGFGDSYPYGTQVLYLVGWPGGVEALLKLTRKLENSGGHMTYVASLQDFRESLGRCRFVNATYYAPQSLGLA